MLIVIRDAEQVMGDILSSEDGDVAYIVEKIFGTAEEQRRAIRIMAAFEYPAEIDHDNPPKTPRDRLKELKKLNGIGIDEIAETMLNIGYCLGRMSK